MKTKKIKAKAYVLKARIKNQKNNSEQEFKKKVVIGLTSVTIMTSAISGAVNIDSNTESVVNENAQVATSNVLEKQEIVIPVEEVKEEKVKTAIIKTEEVKVQRGKVVELKVDAPKVKEEAIQRAEQSPVMDDIQIVHNIEAEKLLNSQDLFYSSNKIAIENYTDENMKVNVHPNVRALEAEIKEKAKKAFPLLEDYTELILLIIDKESGGKQEVLEGDIMQASQSAGLPMNTLPREESLQQGFKKINEYLKVFYENEQLDARYFGYAYNGGNSIVEDALAVGGGFKIANIQEWYDRYYQEGKARGEVFYQDEKEVPWLQVKFGDYTYGAVLMSQMNFEEEIATEVIGGTYISDATVEGKEVLINVNNEEIRINELNVAGLNKDNANNILDQLIESGQYVNVKNEMLIKLLSSLENEEMNNLLNVKIEGKYLDQVVSVKDLILKNPEERTGDEKIKLKNAVDIDSYTVTLNNGDNYVATTKRVSAKDLPVRREAIALAKTQEEEIKRIPEVYADVKIPLYKNKRAKAGSKVILDVGHAKLAGKASGVDVGAANILEGAGYEIDLNIRVADLAEQLLIQMGFEVVRINPKTGEHDYYRAGRGTQANKLDGDILLSIHHNSLGKDQRSEVIYAAGGATSAKTKEVAQAFQAVHAKALPTVRDGGAKGGDIGMLIQFERVNTEDTPAIIVEPLAISSVRDAIIAEQEAVIQSLANGYVNTLLDMFGEEVEATESKENKVKEAESKEDIEATEPKEDKVKETEPKEEVENAESEEDKVEETEPKEEVENAESEEDKVEETESEEVETEKRKLNLSAYFDKLLNKN